MSVRVFKNPDEDNDTLVIQFDDDGMFVIHHGSAVMEPFSEGAVDFDWVELTPPADTRVPDTITRKAPTVAAKITPHLDVDIALDTNGRVEVSVRDGAAVRSMTATRHYDMSADAYVGGPGLQTLYFDTKDDADAYVATGKPGTAHTYIDRPYPVGWELPFGAYVQDLADVIDYARGIDRAPLFDYFRA